MESSVDHVNAKITKQCTTPVIYALLLLALMYISRRYDSLSPTHDFSFATRRTFILIFCSLFLFHWPLEHFQTKSNISLTIDLVRCYVRKHKNIILSKVLPLLTNDITTDLTMVVPVF
jgi:hypothetical protein